MAVVFVAELVGRPFRNLGRQLPPDREDVGAARAVRNTCGGLLRAAAIGGSVEA